MIDDTVIDKALENINKSGARRCISSIAQILKQLLHDMDNDKSSSYKTDIEMVENNLKAVRKILKVK
jgi:translation initiation factor 2B subunit (eIF-2B alpha/beta/delta family)